MPEDSVAEWLRRWIANPLLFERVGSNPTTVDLYFLVNYLVFPSIHISLKTSSDDLQLKPYFMYLYLGTLPINTKVHG